MALGYWWLVRREEWQFWPNNITAAEDFADGLLFAFNNRFAFDAHPPRAADVG